MEKYYWFKAKYKIYNLLLLKNLKVLELSYSSFIK